MTILYAGGEDTSVTFIGSATTNNGRFRSSFARESLLATGAATDPPANRIQVPTFTSSSVIWVHAQVSFNDGSLTTTSNTQTVIVRSPDGVSRVILRGNGTSGVLKLSTRNAAGTITDVATASAYGTTTPQSFDLKVDFANGALLYMNGSLLLNYSGDLRTDAATLLNQVEFSSPTASNVYWSELIIADEDTRSMALWTLVPQAAGNTQAWTPNTLANINKITINDATSISTANNGDLSLWTTPTSAPSGQWAVKAIVQEARVQVGTMGPQHFDWVTRTASTNFAFGASNAPTTSFSNFNNQLWTTNPNTAAPWSITDIASGFNLGIKSLA